MTQDQAGAMTDVRHVVLVPLSLRSHLRLLLQLLESLLLVGPSNQVVTLLVTTTLNKTLTKELGILRSDRAISIARTAGRLATLEVEDGLPLDSSVFDEKVAFKNRCRPLLESLILGNGSSDNGWPRPQAFVGDMFRTGLRNSVREICEENGIPHIPVLHFWPTMALALHRFINTTEEHGAYEGMRARLAKNREDGMDENDAIYDAIRFVRGIRLTWPDLPPMYDYEFTSQAKSRPPTTGTITVDHLTFKTSRNTDGILCNGLAEIDGKSLKHAQEVLRVPVYGVGLQLSDRLWDANDSKISGAQGIADETTFRFLGTALGSHGKHSVVYISFGSIFWPTSRPEMVEIIIRTMLLRRTPFILSLSSPKATVDPELRKEAEESGLGFFTPWAPQLAVLKHDATGCFITHCGMGSVSDAIVASIPIITIPFAQDQPALSAHFTHIRKVGIQLNNFSIANDGLPLACDPNVVVRASDQNASSELQEALDKVLCTSSGKEPPQRIEMTERLTALREQIMASEAEGGESWLDLQAFVRDFVL